MNFKHIAAAALLAGCAVGATAATVTAAKNVGTTTSIGTLTDGSSFTAHDSDGVVTWTVPYPTKVGSTTTDYYDVISDVYTFTLTDEEMVTASAQSSILTAYTLSGAKLSLWEVTSSGNVMLDSTAFSTGGSTLEDDLDAGSYYYLIQGTTQTRTKGSAANPNLGVFGGKYTFQVSSVSVVPEPANAMLLLAGLGLFGFVAKRRKQA